MHNFDPDRFLRIQDGAVALAEQLHAAVKTSLDEHGVKRLIFAGTGGAGILMGPAALLLATSSAFPSQTVYPAELTRSGEACLGPGTLVVLPSLSGTTPETLAALRYSKQRGALTLALVGHADSPIAQEADVCCVNFAEDDTSSESFYLQSLLIALAIMAERKEIDDFDTIVRELRKLPAILVEAKNAFDEQAQTLAGRLAETGYHIIVGAGSTWPEAHYYGMCILEEMQWIRTRPVHGADFFHGTLELLEPGVSVLALKGEDPSRELMDRVTDFARQYTDELTIIDTRDIAPGVIPSTVRGLVSPILLATVLERTSAHLEAIRSHPLTTRRYYRRVPY